ncbi:hypothetical protein PRZ48_005553 [Zasmidium cellare]|uniref:Rhodopsin domain-containing protein n=1 Tax=Zasmidium cellare TaxID=395010 RepID=A0ABR0EKV1_ZASCE|nr:hypothetical protein PRZ48_005553 [Zasmidium cellare]
MASSMPPYFVMDGDHRGASVIVTAFSLIAYMICMAGIRLCVTRKAFVEFHAEDVGTALSIILSIVSYLLFYRAVPPGLGSHQAELQASDATAAFRMLYAAQMIGITAIWAAKLSAAALHWGVEFNSTARLSLILKISFAVTVAWGPLCLGLTAVQCLNPQCKDHSRQELGVVISNMVSDVWLAVAPLHLVNSLKVPLSKRLRVGFLFAGRLIVPCIAAGQLTSLTAANHNADKTFSHAVVAIWSMVVIFFSVLASVIPRTQKFWGALQSGGTRITGDEDEREFIWDWKNRLMRSTVREVSSLDPSSRSSSSNGSS